MIVNRRLRQFISHPKGWNLSCQFSVKQGVDFCGYRHFNNFILLRKSTKLRQKKRIIKMFRDFNNKKKIEYYRHSLASMKGWLIHAKTKNLIKQWNIHKLELLLYTKK